MNYGRGFVNPPENEVRIRAPWMPQTPGNPIISRSNGNGVPVGRHVINQPGITNFQDLIGCSDQQFQQHMNYNATRENFSTIGFMGQNDRSYDLGVQQAQQGGSNQRVGSYNLGVQQAQQGGSNQRVGSYTDNFGNDSAVCYNNPLAEVFTKKSAASVASANGAFSRNMQSENILPTILNSYTKVDSSWTEGNFTSLLLGSENPNLDSNHLIMANKSTQMPGGKFLGIFLVN